MATSPPSVDKDGGCPTGRVGPQSEGPACPRAPTIAAHRAGRRLPGFQSAFQSDALRRYWPRRLAAKRVPLPGFEPARGPVTAAHSADFPAIRPPGYRSGPLGSRSRLWHNCGAPSRARGALVARVRRCEWWWAKAAVPLSALCRAPAETSRCASKQESGSRPISGFIELASAESGRTLLHSPGKGARPPADQPRRCWSPFRHSARTSIEAAPGGTAYAALRSSASCSRPWTCRSHCESAHLPELAHS